MYTGKGAEPKIARLRAKLHDVDLLIVDEISTTSAVLFYLLQKMLRSAFNTDLPMGGKNVVLLGDFAQLPALLSTSLSTLLVHLNVRTFMAKCDPISVNERETATEFKSFRR